MKVIDSCGCVFCDMALKPVRDRTGQRLIHIVRHGARVEHIDCTKRPEAETPPP